MEIKKLGVVGAGQMGSGIAQVAASVGMDVWINDISDELIAKGISKITRGLEKLVSKEKITKDDAEGIASRLHRAPGLGDLAETDFVVEAATEREDLKLELFGKLDRIAGDNVILASNTSSISITRIASSTRRPDKVIGMHFMNPVPVMKLVEIINGLATSQETAETTVALAGRMGKTCAYSKDFPGFIVNRILMPMINEAVYALYEGIGRPEDIDTGMKLGTNQPMGPLALADLVGLDTCLAIMEVLHRGLGDSKYRPCPLLRQYVDSGWLGRKTGRGFYSYEG
jgi:3-hydroxybutyryl-CoA dehydrogenase